MSLDPHFNNIYDDNDFFSLRQIIPSTKFNNYSTINLDVKETNTSYIINADIPGVEKKNININLDNNMLTISSSRKNERNYETTEKYHHYERSYGNSSRTIYLPSKVNSGNIISSYKDGVLHLTISKKN